MSHVAGAGIGAFGGSRRAGLVRIGLLPGHRYLGVGPGAAGLAGRADRRRRGCHCGRRRGTDGQKKVAKAAPPMPTETVESVKKDVQEIKESARR
jgi:hypothetical protein